MKLKSILSTVVSAIVLAAAVIPTDIIHSVAADSSIRDMTTMEIITDTGIGINLGNTFESCGDWIVQWGDGTPNSYETA